MNEQTIKCLSYIMKIFEAIKKCPFCGWKKINYCKNILDYQQSTPRNVLGEIHLITTVMLLFAIAIMPWLFTVHKSYKGREYKALQMLRTYVHSAQYHYRIDEGGYAGSWSELRDNLAAAGKKPYLKIDLSESPDGYKYTLIPDGDWLIGSSGTIVFTDYICIAEPVRYGRYMSKSFCIDSSGEVWFENGKTAHKNSKPYEPGTVYYPNVPWTM